MGGLTSRELGQILWDEGADVRQIGLALRDGAGRSLATIADVLDDQLGRSYTLIADVLWNTLGGLTPRELGQFLWDEGADVYQIGFALRDGAGRSLETVADVLDDQLGRSYYLIGKVLWDYLGGLTDVGLARIIWNEGANFDTTVDVLVDVASVSFSRAVSVVTNL